MGIFGHIPGVYIKVVGYDPFSDFSDESQNTGNGNNSDNDSNGETRRATGYGADYGSNYE